MAQFHFVEDYERLVERLIAEHPLDKAMELAVGGAYEGVGEVELKIIRFAGLKSGFRLLDLGCGSGRLANALSRSKAQVSYLGIDIIKRLLDYAKTMVEGDYRFKLHRQLSIPALDASFDMVCAFSLFTHLLHHESYIYMLEAFRVLQPGGTFVFSFLEFSETHHWTIFLNTVAAAKRTNLPHLNSFIDRDTVKVWAERSGFTVESISGASDVNWVGRGLGQTVAVLRRK